ncbi:Aste57867_6919 [Aphanomyces stellatus]|uniref:Aste57867_6919 protein n=1 Tax=Aphanomyces stellatus TaxID=120398 RepID=A0A485KFV2_9STRA|nr:hypothetical protein As57867_006897 [Aphanomyces stellatus]VFT83871.1 Aste57867_6919 [Aphanomyces stellatus]
MVALGKACAVLAVATSVHACSLLGFYKPLEPATLSTPCPGFAPCSPGFYCRNNQALPCPAGTYGNATQLYHPTCSGLCPAGHVCAQATVEPQPCGSANVYCPVGSKLPRPIPAGYYSTGGTPITREASALCTLGSYCVDGNIVRCPASTYGASTGMASATCSDVCPAGSYCPEGSVMPLPCPGGTYGESNGLTTAACTGVCPNGYYCPAGTAVPIPCPVSHLCLTGSALPVEIPPGQYFSKVLATSLSILPKCNTRRARTVSTVTTIFISLPYSQTGLGQSTCSGSCPAGFYCPVGTITPMACSDPNTYCPLASPAPFPVALGYYSTPLGGPGTSQLQCEPGAYCINGIKTLCPAGSYGSISGLASSACSGLCPPGLYCPTGSAMGLECGDPDFVCPQGSAQPQAVPSGSCGVGQTVTTQSALVVAPAGSYALKGQCYVCPAGYFGATPGLVSLSCSGICAAGYYCPLGSTSPNQYACGLNTYCPPNSPQPLVASTGFYTFTSSTDPCPVGQYRATPISNAAVLLGSETALQVNYGDAVYYFASCVPCPLGTFKPVDGDSPSLCQPCPLFSATSSPDRSSCNCFRVPGGPPWNLATQMLYFDGTTCSAISSTVLMPSLLPPNTTYTKASQTRCQAGFYCQQGVRTPCLGGRYGTLAGETNPLCSGLCTRGYYCPVASTSATPQRCGGAHLYCPPGSPYPLPVTSGYYSIDSVLGELSDPTIRDAQAPCEVGYYCLHGLRHSCPAGRFGANVQETNPLVLHGALPTWLLLPCEQHEPDAGMSSLLEHVGLVSFDI